MSPKVICVVVRAAADRAHIDKLAPHDLRRTCARSAIWPAVNSIRFSSSWGVSIQTTERYLGCKQKLRCAVNDRLGIEPDSEITLVASGASNEGEEDVACAEWIAALLRGEQPSKEAVIAAVKGSRAAAKQRAGDSDLPLEDVSCAVAVDAFDFALKAERQTGP